MWPNWSDADKEGLSCLMSSVQVFETSIPNDIGRMIALVVGGLVCLSLQHGVVVDIDPWID